MADGGEMDEEAMRAFFPLSFGKAPARPSSASSSAVHSSTLRKPQNPSNPKPTASTAADKDGGAMIGPPRPPSAPAGEDDDEDGGGGMIGSPRPPPPSAHGDGEDDEGGGMIGPPRPPPAEDDDDEGEGDDDDMEDDGDVGFSRVPLSNEIVLRGHTKVNQSTVGIKERFGKFEEVLNPGCHFMPWTIGHRVTGQLTLRLRQLDVRCETKTKDNVFVTVVASIQYRAMEDKASDAYYKLSNPKAQIQSYVFDVIRASVPKLELDDAFEQKNEIAKAVEEELEKAMFAYGYEIVQTLIVDIEPDEKKGL